MGLFEDRIVDRTGYTELLSSLNDEEGAYRAMSRGNVPFCRLSFAISSSLEAVMDVDSWLNIDEELQSNKDPFSSLHLFYKIHKLSSTDDIDRCPMRPILLEHGSTCNFI